MNSINQQAREEIQLLLKCIDELSKQHAITPHYDRIMKYLEDIPTTDIDDNEKRIRKAKYCLNKQIYDESMERNGKKRLMYTPEFMDKMNAIWDFSRAGQSFVMPYNKPRSEIDKKKIDE